MTVGIILMICSLYWIIFSLIQITQNFKSALVFKVIPFFTGLATMICAMNLFGWIGIFWPMKQVNKSIFKKDGEELQQYLHFRKRGSITKNKKKDKKMIRKKSKDMCRNENDWRRTHDDFKWKISE